MIECVAGDIDPILDTVLPGDEMHTLCEGCSVGFGRWWKEGNE
jgi:hypothetical protein